MYAAGVGVVPTVTITGWRPLGTPAGIVKLIWVTPTDQLGMPTKKFGSVVEAAMPPTVTVTAWRGLGVALRPATPGLTPSGTLGFTLPSPVINNVITCPTLPVRDGFTSLVPSANMKMPGAALDTVK